jgi:hypothetical protein
MEHFGESGDPLKSQNKTRKSAAAELSMKTSVEQKKIFFAFRRLRKLKKENNTAFKDSKRFFFIFLMLS